MPKELKLFPCPVCSGECVIEGTLFGKLAGYCCTCHMSSPTRSSEAEAITAWNALPRALEWTTEPPKIEGYYWLQSGDVRLRPIVVEVCMIREELHALFCGNEVEEPLPISGTRWAGPIPEPQEATP